MVEENDTSSDDATLAFRQLDPLTILDAIDGAIGATDQRTDGRVSALNSYENRVYSIGLEDGSSLVAKFYRPQRWTDATILEEHAFCRRLAEARLPVVEPLVDENGETLHSTGPFRFCLFPRVGGRPPELDNPRHLAAVGRTVAQMHLIGEHVHFEHRPIIGPERLGEGAVDFLVESGSVPDDVAEAYDELASDLVDLVWERVERAETVAHFPIHGDMHPGNILWGPDDTPQLLDFDDCGIGPAIQDLWMFISGDRDYAQARLAELLDGYNQYRRFDTAELDLIEPLRTLRLINYAAWIAERWADPAFKVAFPFFEGATFWGEHILTLKEQMAALGEPALEY